MLTGQMGIHKYVFEMSGGEMRLTDGWYHRDHGYCRVASEGVQMWKMSVDITERDDISISP